MMVSGCDQDVGYVLVRFAVKFEGKPARLLLELNAVACVKQNERHLLFFCFTVSLDVAVAVARDDVPATGTGTRNHPPDAAGPFRWPLDLQARDRLSAQPVAQPLQERPGLRRES
jgi:hypothetical protein